MKKGDWLRLNPGKPSNLQNLPEPVPIPFGTIVAWLAILGKEVGAGGCLGVGVLG